MKIIFFIMNILFAIMIFFSSWFYCIHYEIDILYEYYLCDHECA